MTKVFVEENIRDILQFRQGSNYEYYQLVKLPFKTFLFLISYNFL